MGHDRLRLLVAVALAGFAAAWLSYVHVYVPSSGRAVRWQTTAIGRLQLARAKTDVFRTQSEYRDFLDGLGVAPTPPRIDFSRDDAVLLALGPRSSAGTSIEILRVEEQRGRVLVVARERYTPRKQAVVSYPSVVVLVRATGKPIAVEWK